MKPAPLPANEPVRLRRLHGMELLDTAPEPSLDSFTDLASRMTGMPIALISLVDSHRQWFKSAVGLPQGAQTPRRVSFCGHAIMQDGIFEIEDARQHPDFADNPLVTGPPHVVHYAGAPLTLPTGERIGTLCLINHQPGRLAPRDRELLAGLARSVMQTLGLRESDRQLRRSEQMGLTEKLAEFSPVGMFALDAAGEVVHANERWLRLFGMEDMIDGLGQAWTDFVNPQDLPALREQWQEALREGKSLDTPFRLEPARRPETWLRLRLEPTRHGPGGAAFVGAVIDISDKVRLETALRERNDLLESVIANLPSGLAVFDAQMRHVVSNERLHSMLDLPRDMFWRDGLRFEDVIPSQGCTLRGEGLPLAEALKTVAEGRVWHGDFALRRADGSSVQLNAVAAPCVDSQGVPHTSVILHDVTERNQAVQRLELLTEQLRQSQKMEALGSVAGGIAHDFNNVIAAILGNAVLTRINLDAPAQATRYINEIERAGARARELVRRIMSFSRKEKPVFRQQPIGPLVEEAVGLLSAILPSGISISLTGAGLQTPVLVDAPQLHQLILNLGTNAWQAMSGDTGCIDITLEAMAQRNQLRLVVQDTGSGMAPDVQARMFEPFFTTKPQGQGTGLGLAVVRDVINDHKGEIKVTSILGKGTRIEVSLPLLDAIPARNDAPTPHGLQAASGEQALKATEPKHVVYVDDYDAIARMAQAILEDQGYRVTCFTDSKSALTYVSRNSRAIDIVVTDYNMPALSGLDLARQVRRARGNMPVIIASGHITPELREKSHEAGVNHVFDKSAGMEELCQRIAHLVASATHCDAQGVTT